MTASFDRAESHAGRPTVVRVVFLFICISCSLPRAAKGQGGGQRPFVAPEPVELGFIETASGDLHLEIPMGSFPQRGSSAQPATYKLVYDSGVWTNNGGIWEIGEQVYGAPTGWWLGNGSTWWFNFTVLGSPYSLCGLRSVNFFWTDPTGIQHFFPIVTQTSNGSCSGWNAISSGDAFATDSSGFHMYVTNYTDLVVYSPDGTMEFSSTQAQDAHGNMPYREDSNGNYLSVGGGIIPNANYYDTTYRVGLQVETCGSNTCYNILNSQNTNSQFVVTYATIPVKTDFGQSGVTECASNCTLQVIQSIVLPDNTSYAFKYDCDSTTGNNACGSPGGQSGYYGLLTNITLPTGGQISYTYTTFFDSYGNASRWVSSRTSASGTWFYTPQVISKCSSGQVGCQETMTVKKPSFDSTVYTFTLNNGVWPTQIQSYDSAQNLLSTVTNTWDFSNSCPLFQCTTGASYVRKIAETLSVPTPTGTITKQTQYTYDTPQTGNITAIKEWGFYAGTSPSFPAIPDKATYISYAAINGTNIINRPFSVTVCNNSGSDTYCTGGGGKVAQTLNFYDTQTLKSVANMANHDDQNFGTGNTARGNLTQISKWIAGANQNAQYDVTTLYYDTTGQIYQALDSANNTFAYGYGDVYFKDVGSTSPPQSYAAPLPTNAYLTSVTLPVIGTETLGYYFGSGKRALFTDVNFQTTYSHFFDPLDRVTGILPPIGWSLNTYPASTEVDGYSGIGDSSPSTGCSSCQHTQLILDSSGRQMSQKLVNDPIGTVETDTSYDANGRVLLVSHPYVGTSVGSESFIYDGLDRTTINSHPDGQYVQSVFGPSVSTAGAVSSQQGSPTTYGLAYPVLSFDESGKQKEKWIDGFGRIVEVDLPGTQPTGTHSSGTVTISGGEGSKTTNPCLPKGNCPITTYDTGSISITVNAFSVSAGYNKNSTTTSLASALAAALNVDSSPVTATSSGGVVTITSKATGTASDYALSATRISNLGLGSFPVSTSGSNLTGGTGSETSTFGTPLVTLYTYNALGEVLQVVQGSQTRTYVYDGLGRRTSATIPEAGTTNVFYTTSGGALCSGAASNVCRKTDAKGITTTYTYDALSRLTGKTYSDGTTPTVTYFYDQGGAAAFALNRRTQMTDGSGSRTYTYDKIGRVAQLQVTIGATNYTIGYQYNAGSELTQITYPSGRVVQRSYNVIGQLCEVAPQTSACGSSTSPYSTAYVYNAAGQPTSFNYGNGVAATFGYSTTRSQLTSLTYAKGAQTLFGLNYFYQKDSQNCVNGVAGNNGQTQCITDLADSGRTANYAYDALGRLSTAVTIGSTNYPKWGLSWSYDQFDNRSDQAVTAGQAPSSALTFNPATNQPSGYTYDQDGNLTVEPLAPPNNYGYDAESDLVSYQGGNGTAAYTYDGNGMRVKEVRSTGVTTVYIFSGAKDIAEYDNGAAPNSPSREFIYSGTTVLSQISGGATQYFHQDNLSVRMITDSNGNVIGQSGHFPFGETWYAANTTTNWVFTSYNRDTGETGLDYAMARFYNSRMGSFCSVDPLEGRPSDPLSWNRYTYVKNDPINLTDPSGQGFWSDIARLLMDLGQIIGLLVNPAAVAIVPTFGGGLDPFTLVPGYNPHLAMTPHTFPGSPTFSVPEWVEQTAITGNGTAPANADVLGDCTARLFNVALVSFTQSQPGVAGQFTGDKAGVWTGLREPDAVGPMQFTVWNDVSKTAATLAFMDSTQNPNDFTPGEKLSGYTNQASPFRNWTATTSGNFLNTQIFELGNSLGAITHMPPPTGPRRVANDPRNKEPGKQLLTCYTNGVAGK